MKNISIKKTDAVIEISGLKVKTVIGYNESERNRFQNVKIDISYETDITQSSQTDQIEDAVDYKTLKKNVMKAVQLSRFNLLEKLAAFVLETVLKHEGITDATVKVSKPGALRFADNVSVLLSGRSKA
ncbi:MAG: dihydroneopterin aldolase [Chitinispirillales bacterium]|nr:dihydroneopterin aldolase [Chitinispirillales bacterium]